MSQFGNKFKGYGALLSENFEDYHQHLKKKSVLGSIYRRIYLYPRLASHLIGKVLDIGCGTGEFARYRPNTDAADINPINVEYVKGFGIKTYLIEDNHIDVPDSFYDSILLDNVLEHIEDPKPLLAEIERVLGPKGRVVIGVPGKKGFVDEVDHKVFYDRNSLSNLMRQYHLTVIHEFYMPIKSSWADKNMKQYCLYMVFENDR